jgi:hypothetical protein
MYLDSLEFLDEEREAWQPFEALDELTDDQLSTAPRAAGGLTGRDLIAHLVSRQEIALQVARELAVSETSASMAAADVGGTAADHAGHDSTADEWQALPMAEVRERLRSVPGELRGYLTVVPESRWLKHPEHLKFFLTVTTEHYDAHRPDLDAVLEAAGRGTASP